MTLNELNFTVSIFFFLYFIFIFNFDNNFKSLILSELFWITLYIFAVMVGSIIDEAAVSSLVFFFLIFSAVDVSLGCLIIIIQKKVFKTVNNTHNSNFVNNYNSRKGKFVFFKNIKY